MLSQFHERHPMGSIITDLLQIEEGIFVVKAQVIVNNTVLGTGLAGSTTVEEAEDAALKRALDHAGFSKANLTSFTPQPLASTAPYPPRSAPAPQTPNGHTWSPSDSTPHRGSIDPYATPAYAPTPERRAAVSESLTDPDDLSDLLAQTDVEMKRIGWGPKEGRDFLESQYNKKSRHLLTPAELQDFLNHLRSHVSPHRAESPF